MKYNILAIADIHWGAMDPEETYNNLLYVLDFIKMKKDIDLVIICGDYFDYRLTLNSKPALYALKWFDELYYTCQKNGVQKLRAIKGTKEHDNEQWEAIHPREKGEFFKKFYINTVEETLPGLKCIYCPDETVNLKEYEKLYLENMMSLPDIGFFHGNFNTLLPDMVVQQNLEAEIPNIIYFKDIWEKLIRGPMIAGHWHTFTDQDPLIYIGSYDRWKFGEVDDKGFLFLQYDTEDHSYFWKRIINPFARRYESIILDSSMTRTPDDFAELRDDVLRLHEMDTSMKIRIVYQITVEDDEALRNFNQFRSMMSGIRGIKIDLKDLVRKKKKKHEKELIQKTQDQYGYILDNPMKIRENIQEFLRRERGIDVSLEDIDMVIGKYLVNQNS